MKVIFRHPLFIGSFFFLMQLGLILLICPEKTWLQSWLSLATHWDSEWYEAIATYGYINIDGPEHTGLLNANVVFFPGYPYLVRLCILFFGVKAKIALLVVSQTAALLFWWLFFHIVRHAQWFKQLAAAVLVMSFPTSWFFYTAYAESFFMLTCCLMLWLATERRWFASGFTGVLLTATRIIGLPALMAPLISTMYMQSRAYFQNKKQRVSVDDSFPQAAGPRNMNCQQTLHTLLKEWINPGFILIVGSFGCLGFLIYCAIQFDSWHLYFDMERIGWKGTADPMFLFKLPTWVPPPFGYSLDWAPPLPNNHAPFFVFKFFRMAAYSFSEMLVPLFLWYCIFYSIRMCKKSTELDLTSLTWYFAAILIFLFNCFSLSTRHYESMSRCLYPVWVLLIISDITHPQNVCLFRLSPTKLCCALVPILLILVGFWLQLLDRFFLGWWVA
ncbi:MAG: hypothetical protein Q8R83_02555 [Legionellaceae bacterium]|nr:hypothetical protein [Legionellaceae bacterium]